MQIFPSSQKITITKYNAISYSETDKLFFSAAVKNNCSMPGGDKSRTCVRCVLEIINFTNSVLDCFLASKFTNKTFQFPEY